MLLQIRSGNNGMMEYWTRSEACAHDVKEKRPTCPPLLCVLALGATGTFVLNVRKILTAMSELGSNLDGLLPESPVFPLTPWPFAYSFAARLGSLK